MFNHNLLGKQYILIHFKLTNPVDKLLFIDALSSFLNTVEGAFLAELSGVLLVKDYDENSESCLFEISETLSFDFSTKVQFMITTRHTISNNLNNIISKEHKLFLSSPKKDTILYLSEIVLDQLLPKISNPLFEDLYEYLNQNKDLRNMVLKLWELNGNISQAASELYIHRNTLIYRINKFKIDTNLDLKKPQDLLIAFLIAKEVVHENNN